MAINRKKEEEWNEIQTRWNSIDSFTICWFIGTSQHLNIMRIWKFSGHFLSFVNCEHWINKQHSTTQSENGKRGRKTFVIVLFEWFVVC